MQPTAFDRLSRLLATTPTRRTALTGLLATATALVERLGPTPAWAAAKPRTCRKLNKSCTGRGGRACCRGSRCVNGRCRCPKRSRFCRGRCLPRKRCCGNGNCPANQTCRNGRCRCPAGTRRCGSKCVPVTECCAACPGGQVCIDGTCGVPACGRNGPCRVFITSRTYTGNFGGIAGADEICQRLADASQFTRGGKYRAWLTGASPNSSPARRFTNLDRTGPYVRVDGTEVAADWSALLAGTSAAINVTQWNETLPPSVDAWTNTLADGEIGTNIGPRHCLDWSSSAAADAGGVGENYLSNDDRWTEGGTDACSTQFALYCFEQG